MTRRRRLSPLDDLVFEIVEDIAAGVGSRIRPTATEPQKPSVIIDAFVDDVAAQLKETLGELRRLKSTREIKIDRADLTFVYRFQTTWKNAVGVSVKVYPHAGVSSKALKGWRKSRSYADRYFGPGPWKRDPGNFVFGMLGNFVFPHEYVALRLLREGKRKKELERVVDLILEIDADLHRRLVSKDLFIAYAASPNADIVCQGEYACEYVAAVWGDDCVHEYIRCVLEMNKGGASALASYLNVLRSDPKPRLPLNQVVGCAKFIAANGLEWGR